MPLVIKADCLLTIQLSEWHTPEPMPQTAMASQATVMVYQILLPALLQTRNKASQNIQPIVLNAACIRRIRTLSLRVQELLL
jgi:hypothetical protein